MKPLKELQLKYPKNLQFQIVINVLMDFDRKLSNSHHSTPPPAGDAATPSHSSSYNHGQSTPNTSHDAAEDVEPSSLSLAERLAFFSSLCESAAYGSGGSTVATGGARLSSRASSCNSRSPTYASMDRTPRSSIAGSSASVTPTPMDYSPVIHDIKTVHQEDHPEEYKEQRKKQQLPNRNQKPKETTEQQQLGNLRDNGYNQLSRSATEPTAYKISTASTETPITIPIDEPTSRRLKLRTVGKLVMPDTFLNGHSYNCNSNNKNIKNNSHRNSCLGRIQTQEDTYISMGVRTIGKIKSPFIEQQEQQQQERCYNQIKQSTPTDTNQIKSVKSEQKCGQHSPSNEASDSGDDAQGSDSGKENCAANQQKQQQQSQQHHQQMQPEKIPEVRRKLAYYAQISVVQKSPQPVNRRHTTELGGSTATVCLNGSRSTPQNSQVDERFAKYFGVDESYNSTTTLLKTRSVPAKVQPDEALNEHVRVPSSINTSAYTSSGSTIVQRRRELLKRTRAMSLETPPIDGSVSPTAMPSAKRTHSPAKRCSASSVVRFEDIVVTADELHAAGQEFKRLCGEILGT